MVRILALLAPFLLVLNPLPAQALSCLPYSPEQAFLNAQESPDRYVIVHGRLDFNPADLPQVEYGGHPWPDNRFFATLTGFSLTGAGFTARFVRQIRVNAKCLGQWCGLIEPGRDYLVFLKKDSGYLLELAPCGGMAFAEPDEALLERVHQCLLGEECGQPEDR